MRLTASRRLLSGLAGLLTVAALLVTPAAAADPQPQPQEAGWTTTGNLHIARERAAAVLLNDGTVLMMGGRDCNVSPCDSVQETEIYDPATGRWSYGPSLNTARSGFEAVLLGNGKVLAIGGGGSAQDTADLYDPGTNTFGPGGSFNDGRSSGFAAVLLDSGEVLIVGGCCTVGGPFHWTTWIYQPIINLWSQGPDLSIERYAPTATLLPDGKVLVAGGMDDSGTMLASTELYDPVTDTFSPGATMFDARRSAQAALMPDGRVLMVEGLDSTGCLGSSEVYDPVTDTFTEHRTGLPPRSELTATPVLTNDGRLLVAGGRCSPRSAGLYEPGLDTWEATPYLLTGRRDHVLVRLRSGQVLAAGGTGASGSLRRSELYTRTLSATAYATPSAIRVGATATVAGSGFAPGETVELSTNGFVFATTIAEADGTFSVTLSTAHFTPRVHIDKAEGLTSGRFAYFRFQLLTN